MRSFLLLNVIAVFLLVGYTAADSLLEERVTVLEVAATENAIWRTTVDYVLFTPLPSATGTPTPTRTVIPTSSPSMTFEGVPLEPSQELHTGTPGTFPPTASDTPTQSATRTPTQRPTAIATDLPQLVYARNVSGFRLRIRACPALTCEQLGWVQANETIVVDPTQQVEAGGFQWVRLWNESGWVAYVQVRPAQRYLEW